MIKRSFGQGFYSVVFFATLTFTLLEARGVSFILSAEMLSEKAGATLSLSAANVFLVADEEGHFRSSIDGAELIDLALGSYEYELALGSKIIHGILIVDVATPLLVELSLRVEGGDPKQKAGSDVRRLQTVRVSRGAVSDSRSISIKEARQLPGGLGDPLRSISSLPGVTGGTGLSTSLFVRGGRGEDVSYRFDNITIGSPYHELFFFSIFPAEILSRLLFYPGGYPVKYENVQGSVVDIGLKDFYDYQKPYDVAINISLITASVSIAFEFLDKFRLSFGGRRTYLEAYIPLVTALGLVDFLGDFNLLPIFYDAHTIFQWQIDPARHLKFIFLYSGDNFVFNLNNSQFRGARPGEQVLIDSSYGYNVLWDSEALVYEAVHSKYEYAFFVSRYSKRSIETNREVETYNVVNEDYNMRHSLDFFLTDYVTLGTFVKYSLVRGHGGKRVHEAGAYAPDPIDFFAALGGIPSGEQAQDFIAEYDRYKVGLIFEPKDFATQRLSLGLSLEFAWYSFVLATGTIFYLDTLSTSKMNADFRARGTYDFSFSNSKVKLFAYLGRYIQYPLLVRRSTNDDQYFFQDYSLDTPHTYQFGLGGIWVLGNVLEISLEPYLKLFREQIIENPTYSSVAVGELGRDPSMNFGQGHATGVEFLVKKMGDSWLTGWVSYTWSLAYLEQLSIPAEYDRSELSSTNPNNAPGTHTFSNVFVPVPDNIEHSIKVVMRVALSQTVAVSLRFFVNSGQAFSPKLIGTNSSYAGEGCTKLTFHLFTNLCSLGFVFVDDPNKINSERLPWRMNLDFRFDWTYAKNEKWEASVFIDILSLEAIFFTNVTSYAYNRLYINYSPASEIADPAPARSRVSQSNSVIIPVIGFEFKF